MLLKLKNLMHYGGLDKETINKISSLIDEANRTNMFAFTVIGFFVSLALTVVTGLTDLVLKTNFKAYIAGLILMTALVCVNHAFGKKSVWVTRISIMVFLVITLSIGIVMSAVIGVNERTSAFFVLQMALSIVFAVPPFVILELIVVSDVVYAWLIFHNETGFLLQANITNMIVFGTLSLAAGCYISVVKTQKFLSDYQRQKMIERDQLTGLLNRRSFEVVLEELRTTKYPVSVVVLDVNGLKRMNDHYGHKAGDQLIRNAGDCIKTAFGEYGKCFRTGGDEFTVIMRHPLKIDIAEMCGNFNKEVEKHNDLPGNFAVALGVASAGDSYEGVIDELLQKADDNMYLAKAQYYKEHGKEEN